MQIPADDIKELKNEMFDSLFKSKQLFMSNVAGEMLYLLREILDRLDALSVTTKDK